MLFEQLKGDLLKEKDTLIEYIIDYINEQDVPPVIVLGALLESCGIVISSVQNAGEDIDLLIKMFKSYAEGMQMIFESNDDVMN